MSGRRWQIEANYLPAPVVAAATRLFDAGRSVTAPEVAADWGISVRTAQRWLLRLETVIPLEFETVSMPGCAHVRLWRKVRISR